VRRLMACARTTACLNGFSILFAVLAFALLRGRSRCGGVAARAKLALLCKGAATRTTG